MTDMTAANDHLRATIDAITDDSISLRLPHTDYVVRLALGTPRSTISTPVGKRIVGVVEAEAMRFHAASGGGKFIEPVIGEPRIVAGTVRAIDAEARRVLIDIAMPVWITLQDDQDLDVFAGGSLVTGYLRSGATFTPVGD